MDLGSRRVVLWLLVSPGGWGSAHPGVAGSVLVCLQWERTGTSHPAWTGNALWARLCLYSLKMWMKLILCKARCESTRLGRRNPGKLCLNLLGLLWQSWAEFRLHLHALRNHSAFRLLLSMACVHSDYSLSTNLLIIWVCYLLLVCLNKTHFFTPCLMQNFL